MVKPQFIRTEGGEQLVVLAKADYDELIAHIEDAEDAALSRMAERAQAALAAGDDILLPSEVAKPIMNGASPVRTVRLWRGLTQKALAASAGIDQGYLSAIERGRRVGSAETLKTIARVLEVPISLLLPD